MSVCRLIFRLDFGVNFGIIEHTGQIMQTLWKEFHAETGKSVDIQENRDTRAVLVRFVSEDGNFMQQFNVEPTCIHGTIETVDGLDIDRLSASSNPFKSLSVLADQICSDYNVENILRSGLRFFYFNKLSKTDGDIFKIYSQMFNSHVLNELRPQLGTIEDYGIVFDGSLDAELKYHFRTGPYRSQEAEKYLTVITKNFSKHADFDMICDIDFYETNFSLSARPLLQVYRPIIGHIKALIRSTEGEVIKLLEAA